MNFSNEVKEHFTFKNDILFKRALQRNADDTQRVRNVIISSVTGLNLIYSEVHNPEVFYRNDID